LSKTPLADAAANGDSAVGMPLEGPVRWISKNERKK
jgi:hypothetical protein